MVTQVGYDGKREDKDSPPLSAMDGNEETLFSLIIC